MKVGFLFGFELRRKPETRKHASFLLPSQPSRRKVEKSEPSSKRRSIVELGKVKGPTMGLKVIVAGIVVLIHAWPILAEGFGNQSVSSSSSPPAPGLSLFLPLPPPRPYPLVASSVSSLASFSGNSSSVSRGVFALPHQKRAGGYPSHTLSAYLTRQPIPTNQQSQSLRFFLFRPIQKSVLDMGFFLRSTRLFSTLTTIRVYYQTIIWQLFGMIPW